MTQPWLTCPLVAALLAMQRPASAPAFLGAGPGEPVEVVAVALPPVVVGPFNEPQALLAQPFALTFERLVSAETLITTEAQMMHVWRRLFTAPYPAEQFDFGQEFVIFVGGGLMHPAFGFEITNVEVFHSTFSGPPEFPVTYDEASLAVVATTFLPGPKPPEEDPVYKVAAVRAPLPHLDHIVFNRQTVALP